MAHYEEILNTPENTHFHTFEIYAKQFNMFATYCFFQKSIFYTQRNQITFILLHLWIGISHMGHSTPTRPAHDTHGHGSV
jgi:hypothetical protein